MSTNTALTIRATGPTDTTSQSWTATIGGALSNITLEDGSSVASVAANESLFYDLANSTDVDEVGDWTLVAIWDDTGTTPDRHYISDPVTMAVEDDNFFA